MDSSKTKLQIHIDEKNFLQNLLQDSTFSAFCIDQDWTSKVWKAPETKVMHYKNKFPM